MSQRTTVDDERLRGRRCGIDNCPSKRYFKIDGRVVCDRGHEQNFLETAEDDEAPVSSMVKRHKVGEGGPEEEERQRQRREALKPLSPEENTLLYLQCYQFILHGQVKSLMKLGLPEELEVGIVMDLWGLYLTVLDIKVPANNQAPQNDAALHNAKEEAHMFSDMHRDHISSDEDDIPSTPITRERAYRSDIQQLKKYPSLLISPLFSYIAIVLLRLPITLSDIYLWITSEKIPYIRADKLIPPPMLRRLNGHTQSRFVMNTKLQPKQLHYWARQLATLYSQEFDITMPSLNYPAILWKFNNAMSFPFETFHIAMKLCKLLSMTEFHLTGEAKWQQRGGALDSKLMAFLIIACKMGYNLENTPIWKEWAAGTEEELRRDRGTAFEDMPDTNVLTMSDEQLDEYMDWVQSTWIEDDDDRPPNSRIPKAILSMFPLEEVKKASIAPVTPVFSPNISIHPTTVGPHTESYTIYRSSELPPVQSRMVQRGAALIGLDEDTLRFSIRWLEQKLNNWRTRGRETAQEPVEAMVED